MLKKVLAGAGGSAEAPRAGLTFRESGQPEQSQATQKKRKAESSVREEHARSTVQASILKLSAGLSRKVSCREL